MEANRQGASRVRVPIAWKFFLLLGVVVPSVLAVSNADGPQSVLPSELA